MIPSRSPILTHRLPSHRWPKHSLPPLVQLGEDDVLCLVGSGLSREVYENRLVHVFWQTIEQEILRKTMGHSSKCCSIETVHVCKSMHVHKRCQVVYNIIMNG